MPAIVTATVVRWEVNPGDENEPFVQFGDANDVSIYVGDSSQNTEEASAIIAKYILDRPGREQELLRAARDGLLQVIGIDRLPVTPPALPPIAPAA